MTVLARRQAILVFLAFAFAYFFSTLLRGVTATLAPALTEEFRLQARDLGLLGGGYFLGFAITQLPLGRWLDRHGPKQVILWFLLAAVVGCLAFAQATSFTALLAARILCGVGVSACLMAPLTGYRRWLSPATQLRANSWMLMTGSLGLVCATLPVQWLLPVAGWRPLFWGLAALILLAMALIAWRVPAWEVSEVQSASSVESAASYAEVWRHPYFRRMAPLGFIPYGAAVAIQTLWAGPWLVRVAGYPPALAAAGLFAINVCMLLAFLAWGSASAWLQRRGLDANRMITWGVPLSCVLLIALIVAGPAAGAAMLALYCVSCTVLSLAQPAVALAFPAALAGRALSAFNLVVFVGVFVAQWGIGFMVDGFQALDWTEANAFRGALAVYLVGSVIAYLYFLRASGDNRRLAS